MPVNMKKFFALILAAAMLAFGCNGALATQADDEGKSLGEMLGAFLSGLTDGSVGGEDEAMPPLEEEEEIVVDELIEVDHYAVNENLSDEWQNILLLGTDSRTDARYSRTDSMIVLSINSSANEAKLTSIMRDTWVHIYGHGYAKLNAACVYGGPQLTMRTINEFFDLNLESYVLVNMQCLAELVDMLGGLRLDVTESERKAMNQVMEEYSSLSEARSLQQSGEQLLLNGNQALAFSRIRLLDSDYARADRQRIVLTTLAKRLQQENALSLAAMVTQMLQYVETNLDFAQIMAIAAMGLQMDMDDVSQFRIPVDGTFESGYYGDVWCIRPNFEKNTELLHDFIYN